MWWEGHLGVPHRFYFFSPYSSWPPVEPIPQKPAIQEELPWSLLLLRLQQPLSQKKNLLGKKSHPSFLLLPSQQKLPFRKKSLSPSSWRQSKKHGELQIDDQAGRDVSNREKVFPFRHRTGSEWRLEMRWLGSDPNGKSLEKLGKIREVLTLIITSQG